MPYNLYKESLEKTPMPIVITDAGANIVFMNSAYCDFLGVKFHNICGKPITDVIKNSRVPTILETRKAEIADRHKYVNGKLKGQEIIVHRIPLLEDDKVIGAFGILLFTSIEDLVALAEKNKQITNELDYYKSQLLTLQQSQYSLNNLVGSSEVMRKLKQAIVKVSDMKSTVLILGESGTGKELVAHSIHNCGSRHEQMFVRVNCASIPESLFEAEFFGYEPGSFSGASKNGKIGKFELANHGTLFMDEIGELPMFMQAKLLRALQEKEITHVGGNKTIPVDVRIIAATNKNLEEMVKEGKFREDLYYRLNILNIRTPSLREHKIDLREITEALLSTIIKENGVVKKLSESAFRVLENYDWPGNVRELSNVLTKMYYMAEFDIINEDDIPGNILKEQKNRKRLSDSEGMEVQLQLFEEEMVVEAQKKCNGNVSQMAGMLKISRPRIYRILERMERCNRA